MGVTTFSDPGEKELGVKVNGPLVKGSPTQWGRAGKERAVAPHLHPDTARAVLSPSSSGQLRALRALRALRGYGPWLVCGSGGPGGSQSL